MTSSVIGLDASNPNKKIIINKNDRFEQLYIIGSTRQGKSTLIENLVLEDIKNSLGVCLIDPHGDLINNIISRMAFQVTLLKDPKLEARDREKCENIKRRLEQDIIYIDLADKKYVAPFNLFHCEDTTDDEAVENVVSTFLHILQSSFGISPDQHARMNQYFRHIATLLVHNQNRTMLDILDLLIDDEFMLKLVENVPDHWEKRFWKGFYAKYSRNTRRMDDISMITNKIEEFISPVMRPWFGDTKKTIHFRELMDKRKIVLIKSNPQWETITKIVGNVVIAQLLDAAYSRRDIPLESRKQMNVYVDEYQKFASEDFAKLFSEAAKYGLSMSISQQVLEQVDPAIKAVCKQAKNFVVFNVSSDNAKELASVFDCSPQPSPPRYEPLRTPVMEPIQYMVNSRNAHPKDAVRQFIETYGKSLIDNAKREEELEQDNRREQQRFEHDLITGVRYLTPPVTQVTYENRLALKTLNDLFYQAMMYGKKKQDTDTIPISNLSLLSGKLRGIDYSYLLQTSYEAYAQKFGIEIVDPKERTIYLQKQLDELPSFRQAELAEARHKKDLAEKNWYRTTLEKEKNDIYTQLIQFIQGLGIVRLEDKYFIAYGDKDKAIYSIRGIDTATIFATRVKYLFAEASFDRIDCFSSIEDAFKEICSYRMPMMSGIFMRKENIDILKANIKKTLLDVGFWQRKRAVVEGKLVSNFYYRNNGRYEKEVLSMRRELDVFTLIPKIEKFWWNAIIEQGYLNDFESWHLRQRLFLIWSEQKEIFNMSKEILPDEVFVFEKAINISSHEIFVFEKAIERLRNGGNTVVDMIVSSEFVFFKRQNKEQQNYISLEEEIKAECNHIANFIRYKCDKENICRIVFDISIKELESEIGKNISLCYADCIGASPHMSQDFSLLVTEKKRIENEIADEKSKVEEIIRNELYILNDLGKQEEKYRTALYNFEQELRQIMRELAEAPVEADSGLMQDIPAEIPSSEVELRIANQLKQLPKYTARVRVPSGEYTIKTIKPEGQIGNTALQKRIVEIQERNRKSGYLRLRSEVKEEIKKRYEQQPQPSTPQGGLNTPPPVQQQQKVAIPVAAQAAPIPRKGAIATPFRKQCPDCGVQNSPTANFCQGCGKKLP